MLRLENIKKDVAVNGIEPCQNVDKVIVQFASWSGASVKIEIQVEDEKGFDENLQRAIRENCNMLRIETAEREAE